MFKSILRFQTIRLSSVRRCSTNVIDQNKPIKIESKQDFNQELEDFIDNLKRSTNNNQSTVNLTTNGCLNEKIKNCNDVDSLLKLLALHKSKLANDELEIIFKSINSLFLNLGFKKDLKISYLQSIRTSSVYQSLLDYTEQQIGQLTNQCLLNLIQTFSLTLHSQPNEIFFKTYQELKLRSTNDLKANEIIYCSKQINNYLCQHATHRLFQMNHYFISNCKFKLLNDKFDFNDTKAILNYYSIFLKPENDPEFDVIKHLTEKLLAPDYQLTFKESVGLLKKIKKSHLSFKVRRNENTLLIDRYQDNDFKNKYEKFEIRYKKR